MDRKVELLEKYIDESTNQYTDFIALIENEIDSKTKAQMTQYHRSAQEIPNN